MQIHIPLCDIIICHQLSVYFVVTLSRRTDNLNGEKPEYTIMGFLGGGW